MYIEKLKVRPRKNPPVNMCAPQLATMLNCWATTRDISSSNQCKVAAEQLFHCMQTTPFRGRPHKPTINYHLSRLNKKIQ